MESVSKIVSGLRRGAMIGGFCAVIYFGIAVFDTPVSDFFRGRNQGPKTFADSLKMMAFNAGYMPTFFVNFVGGVMLGALLGTITTAAQLHRDTYDRRPQADNKKMPSPSA